ncbi:argininosuccinate lyase, partial [Candidatus Hakubella thermalkaliphila]
MKKLWGSRFTQETEKRALSFTSSLSFDKRLYRYDILGSIAHVRMLASCGIISEGDGEVIVAALEEVEKEMFHDQFSYLESDEDIHTAIERGVVEKVGSEIGGKLHTARSRNDQVALDLRMYLKDEQAKIMAFLGELIEVVLSLAHHNLDLLFPGYTHLQRAQPVLLSHHFMAYGEMLRRDYERLEINFEHTDHMPLGSGALAGVSYPVDREMLARELKFSRITRNSMDAVSDRDFALEFLSNASILMVHLSRLAEEMILWSTSEFGFIELSDRYATGSSMMPQKKNPDIW